MQKLSSFAILLSVLVLAGAGCANKNPGQNTSTPPVANEGQTTTPPAATTKVALYRGAWFDVKYPENFTAVPTQPTLVSANGNTRVKTDEATFTSPDNNIEFFIFSPLWAGDPKEYLKIKDSEELVSEKTDEKESMDGTEKRTTKWVTIKAKDGSYLRSFVSIKNDIGGSITHHVFGIKYKNDAAYEQYKNDYLKFKESLIQYAD